MSFTVTLCRNNSDRRCLDKDVETIYEVYGNLRSDTSIVDPVIEVQCGVETINSTNYIIIPQFGRSYYVKNIKSVRKDIWELTCHVDVLSSFSYNIRRNEAIIKRQEEKWNLYINDNSIKCYQNPYIVTREFPNGFSTTNLSYVLLVAGRPVDGWFNDDNTDA